MIKDKEELIKIEEIEYHYFMEIKFMLERDKDKMLKGLASKEEVKKDWENVFFKNNNFKRNSDFEKGAKRIYYWLFNQLGKPNSSPIGSDMMFETCNSYIHIDIKTAKKSNPSDYKGKVNNVGENQTSYKDDSFNSNLPNFYNNTVQKLKKICLTYIILVVYDDETLEVVSILLISIPNGELNKVYNKSIVGAGKGFGKSFRFKYKCLFNLLGSDKLRYSFIYLNNKIKEKEIIG